MTEPTEPTAEHILARVRDLIVDAVARLDPQDHAERVAYCQQSGQHGVRMHFDQGDDLVEFRWGGRRLALLPRVVLLDDRPLPRAEFIANVPDTIPDDWAGR